MDNKLINSSETIKVLDRSLSVLDTLRVSDVGMGVNEIASVCKLSPSSTFRILKSLVANGWVYQGNDARYTIGPKISFVTEKTNMYLALKDISLSIMEKYTAKHNQAMNLLVRDGSTCHILQQSRTSNLVDYTPPINSKLPIHACAGGKILLTELPISVVENILDQCQFTKLTPYTITTADAFWKELRTVAKQGYAIDNRESTINGHCISVPVRDKNSEIIGALSFSGFIAIEDINELLSYLPDLKEASSQIANNLCRCWGK